MLPLLFHANHASFPGYVSPETPVGISNYTPPQQTLDIAKKAVKSYIYKRKAQPRYDIHALYLMGSSGTIAYSEKSDFDIWLCYAPNLEQEQIAELARKCQEIESWAAEFSLEVHFFLMNASEFAAGKGTALSGESSGSAQHHLLLDEFYRTALLLAGRYPLWWFVPPEEEVNYDRYSRDLLKQLRVHENDVLDFGGLPEAPAEEFFGASLWQLYKSIDSPYKAILKLLLMEYYAASYPKLDLLSIDYKRAVYAGEHDLAHLDPYLMLYHTTASYLEGKQDSERLNLLRQCFYYKVNEHLSTPDDPNRDNWRRDLMRQMVSDWSWTENELERLDARPNWRIDQVQKESQRLVDALTRSYQSLSDFAREQVALSSISQDDLNILGRKLYSAFERKPGKIPIVNRGISDDVYEDQVTIFEQQLASGGHQWALYRGIGDTDKITHTPPLHRAPTLIEVLCWCHLNQIANEHTNVSIKAQKSTISVKDLQSVKRCLCQAYPSGNLQPTVTDAMSKPRRINQHMLLVNIGWDLQQHRLRTGQTIASSKVDALSYGGVCENQVLSLDHIIQSSWQEVSSQRYEGIEGIFAALAETLRWARQSAHPESWLAPETFCFSLGHGVSIARRIRLLFTDIEAAFRQTDNHCRYFLSIGRHIYLLWLEDSHLQHQRLESYDELKQRLSESRRLPGPVIFDRYCLTDDLLPMIYQQFSLGRVQLFHVIRKGRLQIFIIDERGALFTMQVAQSLSDIMLHQITNFLAQSFCRPSLDENDISRPCQETAYYQISRSQGEMHIQRVRLSELEEQTPAIGFHVEAIINRQGHPEFTLRRGHETFSSRELGDKLFSAVASALLADTQRRDPGPGLRVMALECSAELLGLDKAADVQSIHLLRYRQRVEKRLENAMASARKERQQTG